MKKIISIIICLCLILTSIPISASAQAISSEEMLQAYESLSNDENELFAPIIVDGENAIQAGVELETEVKKNELLVDVSSIAEEIDDDEFDYSISTENGELLLNENSKNAVLVEENTSKELELGSKIIVNDEAVLAPIDDIAELCNIDTVKEDGKTVYVKPYQTKRLIVKANKIPELSGVVNTIEYSSDKSILEFETEQETREAYDILSSSKAVKNVTGENVYSITDYTAESFYSGENLSWGADYIDSPQAVEYITENNIESKVVVGIVDTGINLNHDFLKGRISPLSSSVVKTETNAMDYNGHGTHVAGIITDNTPSNVEIVAVKAFDRDGTATDSTLANAINYAVSCGVDVINMSFGGFKFWTDSCLYDAVKNAYNAGVICVSAAGNESLDASYIYPASSPYTITVGASDSDGKPASFSNYGEKVDVSAPGVNINSSYIPTQTCKDSYTSLSGTSMATPFVVAACAVKQCLNGKSSFEEAKEYITKNTTEFSNGSTRYGAGIICLTSYIEEERTQPVLFNKLGGYYSSELSIELSSKTENAEIYYTIDGSLPSKENGIRYLEPITISENTQIKAIAYSDSLYKSKRTMAFYRFDNYDLESNYAIDENGYITAYLGSVEELAVQNYINGIEVTGINDSVFRNSKVKSIVLPDSVKQLGNTCFYGTYLKTIIAKGVIAIGDSCFQLVTSLSNMEFGDLLTVGKNAFSNCYKVNGEGINLSNAVSIGDYAFYRTSLSLAIDVPNLVELGQYAFASSNIICINAPRIESVPTYAFFGCNSLEWGKFENTTVINSCAFDSCRKLTSVYAPNVKAVGSSAFYSCIKLTELNLDNVTSLGSSCFRLSGITNISLPKLKVLPNSAFSGMEKLETASVLKQTVIPANCFSGCSSLKEIPDTLLDVEEVGNRAFESCGKIKEISLPNCKKVGSGAVTGMNGLEKIDLPNVIEFGGGDFSSPYLKELTLPNCTVFGSLSNNNYIEKINLPKAVGIGYNGFMYDRALKEVNAPNVKRIDYATFNECKSLERVNLPVLEFMTGGDNFSNCTSLKEVIIPNCKTIVSRAFENCTSLETIDLSSVRGINYSSDIFKNTPNLKHLIFRDLIEVHEYTFADCQCIRELTLPELTDISFYDNSNKIEYLDINFHMPSLVEMYLSDNSVAYGYAIPKGTRVKSCAIQGGKTTTPTTFYTTTDNYTMTSDIDCTVEKAPAIKTDLPSEFSFDESSKALEVQVYSVNPKYAWYYSENGNDYNLINNYNYNQIIPSKSGYYYCDITDLESNETIKSSVCKVSVNVEMVEMKLNFQKPVNILIGENLFVSADSNSIFYAPKGARVQIMYNNEFETLYVNKKTVPMSDASFVFNINENATLSHKNKIKNIADAYILDKSMTADITYTGHPIVPIYEVTYNGKILTNGIDYEVEAFNNINVGNNKAYAIIYGKGEYSGSVMKQFSIIKRSVTQLTISVPDQIYTGSALTPKPIVQYGDIIFTSGYTVSYSNNTRVGKASAKVTFNSDNFNSTSRTVYFRIGIDISNALVTLSENSFVYNGFRQKPNAVTVQIGSTPLKEGVDYTIDFENNADVGTARAVIKGIGDYVSTAYEEFKIVAPEIKKVSGLKVVSVTPSQIKLSWNKINNATSYQIYDTKLGKIVKTVSTNNATISSLSAGSLHNYKVRAVVKIAQKSFYGEYSAILKTCTLPKAPTLKSLSKKNNTITVKYSKPAGASGYQIAYSTSSSFSSSSTKYVTVSNASTLSKTIKSLKKGKKYYVKVRAYKSYQNSNGKTVKRYGSYSKYKSLKI